MLDSDVFTEGDWNLVQLVLTLFRNILAIQDIALQQKSGGTASQFLSCRNRFLELLFHENVMDLVLILTHHIGNHRSFVSDDILLLLEIFHYTFMGQEPELIAKAYSKGVKDDSKEIDEGRPSASCHTLLKPQNRRGAIKTISWDHGILPSTEDKILELLHDFVNWFLSGGYNVLMQSISQTTVKEHHLIQESHVIFFQIAEFVNSFQYHRHSSSKGTTNFGCLYDGGVILSTDGRSFHMDRVTIDSDNVSKIYKLSKKNFNIFCTVEGYTQEWREMYNHVYEEIDLAEVFNGSKPITTSQAAKLVKRYMKDFYKKHPWKTKPDVEFGTLIAGWEKNEGFELRKLVVNKSGVVNTNKRAAVIGAVSSHLGYYVEHVRSHELTEEEAFEASWKALHYAASIIPWTEGFSL